MPPHLSGLDVTDVTIGPETDRRRLGTDPEVETRPKHFHLSPASPTIHLHSLVHSVSAQGFETVETQSRCMNELLKRPRVTHGFVDIFAIASACPIMHQSVGPLFPPPFSLPGRNDRKISATHLSVRPPSREKSEGISHSDGAPSPLTPLSQVGRSGVFP